jgi:hypothetical protein
MPKKSRIYLILNVLFFRYNSVLIFNSLAITLRTTKFNIQKFYMVLALRLCFLRISQLTATFALHTIRRLVLYNRGGVYCAVRTESLI